MWVMMRCFVASSVLLEGLCAMVERGSKLIADYLHEEFSTHCFAISYYEAPNSALVILHYALSAEAERRNALSWPSVKLLRRLMVRLQSCIF